MNRITFFLILFLTGAFFASCQNGAKSTAARISVAGAVNEVLSPAEFAEKLSADTTVQLIDVRTPKEYRQGHIAGARNIDFLNASEFETGFRSLDTDRPLFIYYRSGRRSANAARQLEAMGFREIYDLRGGYLAWPEQ